MAERAASLPADPYELARRAVTRLHRARTQLDEPAFAEVTVEVAARSVDASAAPLRVVAGDDRCPDDLRTVLLDWRDRLGSHVLTARALGELEVHPDLARQLLRRGLDEVLGEAPSRLAELEAALQA
jgi:hypothetical protein